MEEREREREGEREGGGRKEKFPETWVEAGRSIYWAETAYEENPENSKFDANFVQRKLLMLDTRAQSVTHDFKRTTMGSEVVSPR